MNKQQFYEEVYKRFSEKEGTEESKSKVFRLIDAVFDTLKEQLSNNEEVRIRGFGIFSVHKSEARKGRNPRTGEEITVPPRNRLRFRAAKNLYDMLNS